MRSIPRRWSKTWRRGSATFPTARDVVLFLYDLRPSGGGHRRRGTPVRPALASGARSCTRRAGGMDRREAGRLRGAPDRSRSRLRADVRSHRRSAVPVGARRGRRRGRHGGVAVSRETDPSCRTGARGAARAGRDVPRACAAARCCGCVRRRVGRRPERTSRSAPCPPTDGRAGRRRAARLGVGVSGVSSPRSNQWAGDVHRGNARRPARWSRSGATKQTRSSWPHVAVGRLSRRAPGAVPDATTPNRVRGGRRDATGDRSRRSRPRKSSAPGSRVRSRSW